ncbi:rhomboid family intramembrane serine protease [Kitasatospora xanthocidica]|uniref:rhomboid family intramembrane serine protease n=1 Tax=Kitasatospora xanthocidica TaxID=83382 RepID=UPI001678DC24|nr:rhomboid family intramembrane serine protease [Kitasatospora xanthocidica]GHF29810.1 rhomboid family intramembrane serine protease [Kitasatospora xanthocidica]
MLPDEPRSSADRSPEGGPPGCYRHPGTPAGISCTRCERPICPECMVPASVGFHCPECVGAGHAGARRATTRFGGVPAADGGLVTRVLVGVNVVVWLLAAYVLTPRLDQVWELLSVGRDRDGGPGGVADGPDQWYRLLTATFLHDQWWHIGLNMLVLLVLGPPLEEALGRLRFLALYLVAGLGGSTFAFLVAGDWLRSVGASGAIFGLIGATIVMQLRNRGALAPVMAFLVFNLIVTFSREGIDWRAHLGGLALGALTAAGLMYAPRERRGLVQGLAVAGALAVEAAMLLVGMSLYGS